MIHRVGLARVGLLGLLLGLACGRVEQPPRGEEKTPGGRAPVSRAPSISSVPSPPTIVFLGTSLTAGYGLDPEEAYPALIQRKLDSLGLEYRAVNAGVSGESSAGALGRIGWILRQPPAVLVIETGANDGLRGQDLDRLRANLQGIIDSTRRRAPQTRIILAGMEALPNLGADYTRRFRHVYRDVAARNGIPLIPCLLAGVGGVDSLNQEDGIHPNAAGARIVAENVWRVLRPVLVGDGQEVRASPVGARGKGGG